MKATIVIIKQESQHLGAQINQLIREGHSPRIVDGNSIPKGYLELNEGTVETKHYFGDTIKCNKIQCLKCNKILESISIYHTLFCNCGNCKITGGKTELGRHILGPFKELSEYYVTQ
jgi:hypothetical protein